MELRKVSAAYLPEPLEAGLEPGLAYVAFSKWWALWDSQPDMAFTNPERTQYKECAIWGGCSYQGTSGQICLQIWVNNDFTMARGWFMGFAKKLGQTYMTEYHPLNPMMQSLGPSAKLKAYVCAHGERLIEGTMEIEQRIARSELPGPMGAAGVGVQARRERSAEITSGRSYVQPGLTATGKDLLTEGEPEAVRGLA